MPKVTETQNTSTINAARGLSAKAELLVLVECLHYDTKSM